MQNKGRFLLGNMANPTGRGGFIEHPEHINYSGRPINNNSFTYWFNFFKNMPVAEFESWREQNHPDNISITADIAYTRMCNAKESLKEFREIADRTEGKAPQTIFSEEGFFSTSKLEIISIDQSSS